MLVRMTQEDIDNGEPRCSEGCPLARAVLRYLGDSPDISNVSVLPFGKRGMSWRVRLYSFPGGSQDVLEYEVPDEVARKIKDYDEGYELEPCLVELKFKRRILL